MSRKKYRLKNPPNNALVHSPDVKTQKSSSPDQNKLKKIGWQKSINFRPFLGVFYAVLCSIFIVLSSVIVKKLTYISPGQLSLVRNFGTFAGSLPIAVYSVKNILGPKEDRLTLTFRSFMGATALYFNLMAFRYLPLAEASIIMSTLPASVSAAARVFLKEPCGIVQTVAVSLTVAGMLLSIRLPELLKNNSSSELRDKYYIMGLLYALACVVVLTSVVILIRKMQNIHFSVIMMYSGILGTLENTILTASFSFFEAPRCGGWDAFQVIIVGLFGFLGSSCLTLAILTESAGVVSVIKASSDILLSMILQIVFFGLIPDVYNIVGASLVIGSVTIISLRKWLLTLSEDDEKRTKLRYFLI